MTLNIFDFIKLKVKDSGARAISFLKKDRSVNEYSYKDLFYNVEKYSKKLQQISCEKIKVGLIFPNCPEWVFTYLAVKNSNMISVLFDYNLPKKDLEILINNTELDVVITTQNIYNKKLKDISVLCLDVENELKELNNFVIKEYVVEEELEHVSDILFSSGTTSEPTGIMHSQTSLINTTIACLNENNINDNMQDYLALLPLNHIYGLLCLLYAPLISASHVIYLEELTPELLMYAFSYFKPTFLAVVPKICEMFKNKIEQEIEKENKTKLVNSLIRKNLFIRNKTGFNFGKIVFKKVHDTFGGRIKTMCCAGAPTQKETAEYLLGLGFNLLLTYGLTETNIPVSGSRNKGLASDSAGQAYPKISIKIASNGEILIKSPYKFLGYYKHPELTQQVFKDEYFKTGDLGYFDKKERLHITGRQKENILLSTGKKVFPETIEKEFQLIAPYCEEFVVCGLTQPQYNYDEIHLFIVPKREQEDNIRKLVNDINNSLPNYMKVNQLHFVNNIPKTALDKIKRFELLKDMEKKERPTNLSLEQEIIYDCLNIAHLDLDYKTLSLDTKIFEDLGIDSLSTIELLLEVEKRYNISFEDLSILHKEMTVGEFINIVKDKIEKTK